MAENSTAPEETKPADTTALTPFQRATGMIRSFAEKLVGDDRAKQFATTLSLASKQQPKFLQCTEESIVTSMMACVQLDLLPNTPEQLAYLIPYNSKGGMILQFQVGYKGLIRLAQRSNQIKSMAVELVFEGDKFKVKLGTNRQLVHEPNFDVDRTDYSLVTHAYCTAVLTNGEKVFEVVTRKELDKIKNSSKAQSPDSPWNTWPAEMAKKSVIKRAAKLLPSSSEDNRLVVAAQLDSLAEAAKLKYQDGAFIEAPADPEEEAAERKERMAAAEAERLAERKKMNEDTDFEAAPVKPLEA